MMNFGSDKKTVKIQMIFFRDTEGRLRAHLYVNRRKTSTKPAERKRNGINDEEHHYNMLKVFNIPARWFKSDANIIGFLAGNEVEIVKE